jgi:hypothetical protein
MDSREILRILDRCCDSFTFPMLDNGYVYLAATRLSLFRSTSDWAMVIEVFGYSPRSGLPSICIDTFASHLYDRNRPENYVSREAYEAYLANNPNNESRFIYPIDEGPWQDPENLEYLATDAREVVVRGNVVRLPRLSEYSSHGIDLEDPPRIHVFELCRFLAGTAREEVLATPKERRVSIPPELEQILVLDEWRHPDLVQEERPSRSETFQQLAEVLATGDVSRYQPSREPNTDWRNWPEGGRL